MTKRVRLTDRSKSYIRDLEDGQTPTQIAERWGIPVHHVTAAIAQLRRTGHLPKIDEPYSEEVERERELRRARRQREKIATLAAEVPSTHEKRRMQCLAHWRDLDQHHPRGWASYRITTADYTTSIRPSVADVRSMVGSVAAACAHV